MKSKLLEKTFLFIQISMSVELKNSKFISKIKKKSSAYLHFANFKIYLCVKNNYWLACKQNKKIYYYYLIPN